jgi:hypothetical protein
VWLVHVSGGCGSTSCRSEHHQHQPRTHLCRQAALPGPAGAAATAAASPTGTWRRRARLPPLLLLLLLLLLRSPAACCCVPTATATTAAAAPRRLGGGAAGREVGREGAGGLLLRVQRERDCGAASSTAAVLIQLLQGRGLRARACVCV